jgi:hypothetical protein
MKHFGDGRISENDNRLPLKSTEGNMEVNEYDTMQMNEIEVYGNTSSNSDNQIFLLGLLRMAFIIVVMNYYGRFVATFIFYSVVIVITSVQILQNFP